MASKADFISMYLPSFNGGGAERVFINLAKGFQENGVRVDLVLPDASGPLRTLVPKSIRIIDLKKSGVLSSLPPLVLYLKKNKPKALLSAMDHANVIALCARKMARVPTRVVITIHNVYRTPSRDTPYGLRWRMLITKRVGMPLTYRMADGIVAVSYGVARDVAQTARIPLNKIKVIYNPIIDEALFAKGEQKPTHPWLINKEYPVILGVGRLAVEKDFPTLIRAFALLQEKIPSRLLILGEGDQRKNLEELILKLGLQAKVSLPGFVENPFSYMREADLFVLSSNGGEGLSNVLIEALALGTPVISTDCETGPAEVLDDGRLGILVKVGDFKGLSEAMYECLKKPPRNIVPADIERFKIENGLKQYAEILNIDI